MNPLPTGNPRLAVAYRRVSSAEQGQAFGPAAQEKAIATFAKSEGLEVAADYFDDLSGTLALDDRPGLSDALAAVRELGAGTLIVARRDRLARVEWAMYDALRAFELAGARVLFAEGANGNDDAARLGGGIEVLFSAIERERIVKRLARGREAKADRFPDSRPQGGKVPLGYRRTDTGLEIDPATAEQVRAIFAMAKAGKSQRQIAERLSAETGRRWPPTTVAGVLSRAIYKQAKPGRIVDPRIWNAARKACEGRQRKAA